MTAQKGYFGQVPAHSVLPVDAAIHNQATNQKRTRQRMISCLLILAGVLFLLVIASVVGFMCWKSSHSHCNECESDISPLNDVISKSDFADNSRSSSSFEDELDQLFTATGSSSSSSNHPKSVFTSSLVPEPETNVRAPPTFVVQPTTSSIDNQEQQQIEIHQEENDRSRPWYARLPLIGWMFRSEETQQSSTRITISK